MCKLNIFLSFFNWGYGKCYYNFYNPNTVIFLEIMYGTGSNNGTPYSVSQKSRYNRNLC